MPEGEIREILKQVRDAMERGEEIPADVLGRAGEWGIFLRGLWAGKSDDERSYVGRYLLSLSEAFFEPVRLLETGEFAAAARALHRDEVTRRLMSPEMSFALAGATLRRSFQFVQWAITLETAMSLLAAWCVDTTAERRDEMMNDLTFIIGGEDVLRYGFGRSFFGLLMRVAKQRSMGSVVDHLSKSGHSIDIQTLKRWSAGKTLPELTQVKIIIQRCCPEDEERIKNMHWAMRYLSLLGYVSEVLVKRVTPHLTIPGARELYAPWPTFPFGYENFRDWAAGRLSLWCQYHVGQFTAGKMKSAVN